MLGCHTFRTCFLFTVLIVAVTSHPFPADYEEDNAKDYNARAGEEDDDHDDSKGNSDDEVIQKDAAKGDDDSPEKDKPIRMKAESSKTSESISEEDRGSEEESPVKEKQVKQKVKRPPPDIVFSVEQKHKSASDEDGDNNDDVGAHSTKRLGAEEYEPDLRRFKRAVVDYLNLYKSKHKKAQATSYKAHQTTLPTFI